MVRHEILTQLMHCQLDELHGSLLRIVRVQMNAKLSGETSGLLIPEFLGDHGMWEQWEKWEKMGPGQNGVGVFF